MPSLHATGSSPLTTVASESHYLTAEGDLTIPLQASHPSGHYASCQALTLPSLFTPGGRPTFGATQARRQGQRAPQGEPVPPSAPMQKPGSIMPDKPADRKDSMPTERKSMWRTADERRMSDLTRVMEWLERRRAKKLSLVQPQPQPQPQPQAQPQPPPPKVLVPDCPRGGRRNGPRRGKGRRSFKLGGGAGGVLATSERPGPERALWTLPPCGCFCAGLARPQGRRPDGARSVGVRSPPRLRQGREREGPRSVLEEVWGTGGVRR